MRGSPIKKSDTVVAIAGAGKGKSGKVLAVQVMRGRAVVEGLNVQKKTVRRTQANPQGGITEKEGPIAVSNLMLYCANCKKGVRVRRVREDNKSIRKCKSCGHAFDA